MSRGMSGKWLGKKCVTVCKQNYSKYGEGFVKFIGTVGLGTHAL